MPSSRGSSQPRDWAQVSHIAGSFFTIWATREAPGRAEWCLFFVYVLFAGLFWFWETLNNKRSLTGCRKHLSLWSQGILSTPGTVLSGKVAQMPSFKQNLLRKSHLQRDFSGSRRVLCQLKKYSQSQSWELFFFFLVGIFRTSNPEDSISNNLRELRGGGGSQVI